MNSRRSKMLPFLFLTPAMLGQTCGINLPGVPGTPSGSAKWTGTWIGKMDCSGTIPNPSDPSQPFQLAASGIFTEVTFDSQGKPVKLLLGALFFGSGSYELVVSLTNPGDTYKVNLDQIPYITITLEEATYNDQSAKLVFRYEQLFTPPSTSVIIQTVEYVLNGGALSVSSHQTTSGVDYNGQPIPSYGNNCTGTLQRL